MKKPVNLIVFILASHFAIGQQQALRIKTSNVSFDSAATYTIQQMLSITPYDTTEGGAVNQFRRWSEFHKNRIAYDAPTDSNILMPVGKALDYYLKNTGQYCSGSGAYTGNWKCIGPHNNYYGAYEKQGRIDALWVDPDDMEHILAGANMGGLWESTNAGNTWHNITDPKQGSNQILPGTLGANQVAVNPLDHDMIYIATFVDQTYHKHGGYALGLSYTTDGGQTWTADAGFLTANAQLTYDYSNKYVRKLAYMPGTNKLFAISANKVLYKPSPSSSWADITPTSPIEYTDFEFTILNSGKLVVSTNSRNGYVEFWTFTPGTYQWSSIQIPAPSGHSFTDGTSLIADFSIAGNDSLYYLLKNVEVNSTNQYTHFLYRGVYNDASSHIEAPTISQSALEYMTSILISPVNPDVIYCLLSDGSKSFGKSTNRGKSFHSIQGVTHADARSIFLYQASTVSNGLNDILFGGSDGGVVLKKSGNTDFESITGDSLVITQLYSLSNTEEDDRLIIGGAQDNGAISYMKNRLEPWDANPNMGDGFNSKFANNSRKSYVQGWPGHGDSKKIIFGSTSVNQSSFLDPPEYSESFLRPMYFDAANKFYWGHTQIWWNNEDLGLAWDKSFSSEPIGGRFVGDMAMSEPVQDTVYIAYHQTTPNPSGSEGRLFRAFNSQANPIMWTNITPPQVEWNRINDIEVNKKNLKHIWVALGDVNYWSVNDAPADMSRKVYYSNNYGSTWFDISKGLPPLPINKVLYHDGANRLYVGTDVGVFTCDFSTFNPNTITTLANGIQVNTSVEWKCFNGGMPPVIVTDMEFNHCAGKLRIATFGRGIWETNILVDPYPANNPPTYMDEYRPVPQEVISSTPQNPWTGDKYITTGIKVQNGATLTIGDGGTTPTTIHMPKNGVIVVEKGGTLIVDGAKITNSCDECMWAGISVQGTNYAPQTTQYQGKLILKNNAVLEHARNAVGNSFIDDPNRYGNTGGIIQATNTTFQNNARSAEFLAYYDMQAFNDQSYFRNCTFTIDGDYKGISMNYPFERHVTLWDVHGVEFNGCLFENNLTNSWKYKGDGIYAYNADFDVRPYLSGTINPGNTFRRLKHGIVADGDVNGGITHSTIIDQNSFDANSIGIKIINIPHVSAIRNTFTIGNGGGVEEESCKDNIGIYTLNTPQFRIEENVFNEVTTNKQADLTLGTLVDNSGKNNKELYKNSYTGLDLGILARGLNGSYIGKFPADITGLRFICNTFTTNDRDINIMGDPQKFEGIAYWQGYYMPVGGVWKMVSAGNRFMTSTATHIHNTASNFNYFHNNSVTLPTNIVGPVTVIVADAANECASRLSSSTNPDDPVGLTAGRKTDMKNLFWTSKAKRDNRQNDWEGLINDGRSEQEVLDDISGMSGLDAMNLLLGYSPYVSGGVIKGAASMSILDKSMVKEVLIENPDVLRNNEVMAYLSSSEVPDPLDEDDMEELKESIQTLTDRTMLEAEISFHRANMSQAVNMLLTDIKSGEEVAEADSIDVWLNRTGELWAQYQRAYALFGNGDYADAEELLTEFIPNNYALSNYEATENTALLNILAILKDRKEEGRHFEALNDAEKNELLDIEATGLPNSSSLAGSILAKWGDAVVPCINIPENPSSRMAPQKNPAIKKKAASLNVYPNPASEYMVFEYQLEDDKDPVHVTISNTLGQEVGRFELKAKATGRHYWDIRHLQSGNYFYKANSIKKDYGSGKIVVVK